jgi:hypothetical protein
MDTMWKIWLPLVVLQSLASSKIYLVETGNYIVAEPKPEPQKEAHHFESKQYGDAASSGSDGSGPTLMTNLEK